MVRLFLWEYFFFYSQKSHFIFSHSDIQKNYFISKLMFSGYSSLIYFFGVDIKFNLISIICFLKKLLQTEYLQCEIILKNSNHIFKNFHLSQKSYYRSLN